MNTLLVVASKWLESTPWGDWVRETAWGYPFVQLIHFLGLSIWIGTNIAVDLRLLGAGKGRETAADLAADLFALNWTGFGIVLLGGVLLFSGIATSYIGNVAFRYKLGLLVPFSLFWHILVQQKTKSWGRTKDVPTIGKAAGLIEMLLWWCVIIAAVEIPNY